MRVIWFLSLLFVVACNASEDGSNAYYQEGYHQSVGIKDAASRKRYEDQIMALGPIVGGVIAQVAAHPYLVGILIDVIGMPSQSACGGSLISASRILTAAHCWNDGRFQAWRFTAVLGSPFLFHGGLRLFPHGIAVHPNYDKRTLANDIAVLYLPGNVPLSSSIQPIRLPHGALLNHDLTGAWSVASGYGRYSDAVSPTTNTMARFVSLQVISLDQCRGVFGNAVLDSNICTNGYGGVGICRGDSGGPLTVTYHGEKILVGVSSFVARYGCELGFPSVFARVTSFMDWIQRHM
ncbi:brachyurin-like [Ostrinia nubilalis]|uniref:brachyurin-like n=1 Tax=Ostrinia nubilalis TaxID=29057 RepID=UPI00308248A9